MAVFTHEFLSVEGDPIRNYYIADAVGDLPAGTEGELAYQLDTDDVKAYDGAAWFTLAKTAGAGAGAVDRVAVWASATALTSDVDFRYVIADDRLLLGVASITVNGKAGQANVFNEDGVDQDFRVEGDTYTNALHVDASLDGVIVGKWLRVGPITEAINEGDVSAGNADANIFLDNANGARLWMRDKRTSAGGGSFINFYRDRAGAGAVSGDDGGGLRFRAMNSTPTDTVFGNFFVDLTDTTAGSEDATLTSSMMAGGSNLEHIRWGAGGGVVVNESGADLDFRVEGDTVTSLFFVDASTDRIAIGRGSPDDTLHIATTTTAVRLQRDTADAVGSYLRFHKTRSFGATVAGDDIGVIEFLGANSTPATITLGTIFAEVNDPTATGEGVLLRFEGYVAGTNRDLLRMGDVGSAGVAGGVVFNESGDDRDFRVEGDTVSSLLHVDASTDRVGIGTSGPDSRLHVRNESAGSTDGLRVQAGATAELYLIRSDATAQSWLLQTTTDGSFRVRDSTAAGESRFVMYKTGESVFNEDGADRDFRVEGDTITNLFHADASLDEVIIGGRLRVGTYAGGIAANDVIAGTAGSHYMHWDASLGALNLVGIASLNVPSMSMISYSDTTSHQPILFLTHYNTAGTLTPDNAVIGSVSYAGLTTGSTFYQAARVRVNGGVNTASGFPSTMYLEMNAGAGAGFEEGITLNASVTGIIVNEGGLDRDFRAEGDTVTNVLHVDASLDLLIAGNAVQIGSRAKASYAVGDYIAGATGSHYTQWDQSDGRQTNTIVTSGFSQAPLDLKLDNAVPANYHSLGMRYLLNNSTPSEVEAVFFLGGLSTVTAASENAVLRILMMDGGTTRRNMLDIDLATAVTVFNEDGVDHDFRVESDTKFKAIFLDASAEKVWLGAEAATEIRWSFELSSGDLRMWKPTADSTSIRFLPKKDRAGAAAAVGDVMFELVPLFANSTPIEFVAGRDKWQVDDPTAGGEDCKFEHYVTMAGAERLVWLTNLASGGAQGGTVHNDDGLDMDFRVEGDTVTNCLHVDASLDETIIGGRLRVGTITDGISQGDIIAGVVGGTLYHYDESARSVTVIGIGATTSMTASAYSAAGYAPAQLSMTRRGAGGLATPNDQRIGEIRWNALNTVPGYFNPAQIYVDMGTNSTTGGPSTMHLGVDFGDGVGLLDRLVLSSAVAGVIVNNDSRDCDFRVSGDVDTNLLFCDASTDRVGIGTNAPSVTFHIKQSTAQMFLERTSSDANPPSFFAYKNRGGAAAAVDDQIFDFSANILNSTPAFTSLINIQMHARAVTAGAESGTMTVLTKIAGTQRNRLNMTTTETVFNDDQIDLDFRVEGDTKTTLVHVDASLDRVFLGSSSTADSRIMYDPIASELYMYAITDYADLYLWAASDAAGTPGRISFVKRNLANNNTPDNDTIGILSFSGLTTGAAYYEGATIHALGEPNGANGFPTRLRFQTNAGAGGGLLEALMLGYTGGATVFNEGGLDLDFRVESDTQTDAIRVDASVDRVGFFQSTPLARVHITEPTLGNEVFRLESIATANDPNFRFFQGRVATTDATVTTILTIPLATNATMQIVAYVVGRRTDANPGDNGAYIRAACFRDSGGTIAQVGATTLVSTIEANAAWDVTITLSGTNVIVRVTGIAANTITWHCTAHVQDLAT